MSRLPRLLVPLLLLAAAVGCSSPRYPLDEEQLARFVAAGPVSPELDREALLRGLTVGGPYRVAPGDLLAITAPRTLFGEALDPSSPAEVTRRLRVDPSGKLGLPLSAEGVPVGGLGLVEVEQAIVNKAHPEFLRRRPSVIASVAEYATLSVAVLGAVELPGIHELRSDRLSLYGALTAAGGILKSQNLVVGARMIRVLRPSAEGEPAREELVLPVKGLNVPFSDVKLHGGETIEVVRYEPDTFTIVGLVNSPGAYQYPPEVTYNLMQAIATAGGVNIIANPPYATVFRKDQTGEILPATFEIRGDGLVEASDLAIKPGDVIVVNHTAATWTRTLLAEVVNLQFGLFVDSRNNNN